MVFLEPCHLIAMYFWMRLSFWTHDLNQERIKKSERILDPGIAGLRFHFVEFESQGFGPLRSVLPS